MYAIVDRLEGQYAIVEINGSIVDVKLSELPSGIKEGDVLRVQGDKYILDPCETEKRKKEAERETEDIWIE